MEVTTEICQQIWILVEICTRKFTELKNVLRLSMKETNDRGNLSERSTRSLFKQLQPIVYDNANPNQLLHHAVSVKGSDNKFETNAKNIRPEAEPFLAKMPMNMAISFLKYWVSFPELCMVDTAFCSMSIRNRWLNTISSFEGVNIVDSCVEAKDGKTTHLTKLEWLKMKNMYVDELIVQSKLSDLRRLYQPDLVKGMTGLKKLVILDEDCIHWPCGTSEILRANFPCESIESLTMPIYFNGADKTRTVLNVFPNLRELIVRGRANLPGDGAVYLETVMDKFPTQTELILERSGSDRMMLRVFDKCRNLRKVNLNIADTHTEGAVTGVSIVRLVEKCPELRELRVANRHNVNDFIAQKLIEYSLFLEVLDISKTAVTSDGIALILNSCQKITTLIASGLKYNKTDSLTPLCKNLTWLDLSDTVLPNLLPIINLASAFPRIRRLELRNLSMKPATLKMLGNAWKELMHIDLSSTGSTTLPTSSLDGGLEALAKVNPRLQTILVSRRVSNKTLVALSTAACCATLTCLDVSHCAVKDSGVLALSSVCSRLHNLNLENCSAITDVSLQSCIGGFPALRTLNIMKCSRVTVAGIAELVELEEKSGRCVRY